MKCRVLSGISVVALVAVLSGCSGSASGGIETLDELRDAYIEQGFECDNPSLSEDNSYSMYGCENGAMVSFDKNSDGLKRHESTSETMGSVLPLHVQSEGNWHISSFEKDLLAPELGGSTKTYN